MPCLRRYLPPLLLLLPVIFICGKLLLTLVYSRDEPFVRERGWPWVFQIYQEPIPGASTFAKDDSFSYFILLADALFLATAVTIIGLLLIWRRKRTGRLFRFSLRELLLLMAIAAIPCGWWAYHLRQQRLELAIASRWEDTLTLYSAGSSAPGWLRRLTGHDWESVFDHARTVSVDITLPPHATAAEFPAGLVADLSLLPNLRHLYVTIERSHPDQFIPSPLRLSESELRAIEQIETLYLKGHVDNETLRSLPKLPLRALTLDNASITNEGLAILASIPRLEILLLNGCNQINDTCVDALLKLPALRKLYFNGCESLTDAGIIRLAELPHLKSLHVMTRREFSPDLLLRLKEKIPDVDLD
jgi:hypothetical protein